MDLYRSIRLWGRKNFDSVFCKKWKDIEKFGNVNSWNILTSSLNKDSIVYSAGVGHDISFEKGLISRFQVEIELFDPSPTGIATMGREENRDPKIHFTPVGLAGKSMVTKFFAPPDESEGSFRIASATDGTVEFQCSDLSSLMKERGHTRIDLLKMDIEGFEYDVIDEILRNTVNIKQICVEFHHFFEDINIVKTIKTVARLSGAGFALIYKNRFDYTFVRMN